MTKRPKRTVSYSSNMLSWMSSILVKGLYTLRREALDIMRFLQRSINKLPIDYVIQANQRTSPDVDSS